MDQITKDLQQKVESDAIRSINSAFELMDMAGIGVNQQIVLVMAVAVNLMGRALAMSYLCMGCDKAALADGVQALHKDIDLAFNGDKIEEFIRTVGLGEHLDRMKQATAQQAAE